MPRRPACQLPLSRELNTRSFPFFLCFGDYFIVAGFENKAFGFGLLLPFWSAAGAGAASAQALHRDSKAVLPVTRCELYDASLCASGYKHRSAVRDLTWLSTSNRCSFDLRLPPSPLPRLINRLRSRQHHYRSRPVSEATSGNVSRLSTVFAIDCERCSPNTGTLKERNFSLQFLRRQRIVRRARHTIAPRSSPRRRPSC